MKLIAMVFKLHKQIPKRRINDRIIDVSNQNLNIDPLQLFKR